MSKGALVTGIVIIQCPMTAVAPLGETPAYPSLPPPFPMPIPNLAGLNYGTYN